MAWSDDKKLLSRADTFTVLVFWYNANPYAIAKRYKKWNMEHHGHDSHALNNNKC